MLPSETMIWQPEFTDKTLSRKPGAVQAYVFWLYRLKAGETLPRGRFFRKRKPIINVMAVVHDTAFEK
ncbi:hypothetical protein P2S06_21410 [Escherichia coli]